jgi:hypothetical protein
MTKKEKAEIQQRLEDKRAADELRSYIQGWKDALNQQTSHTQQTNKMYLVLALGIILGISIMELITLIIK